MPGGSPLHNSPPSSQEERRIENNLTFTRDSSKLVRQGQSMTSLIYCFLRNCIEPHAEQDANSSNTNPTPASDMDRNTTNNTGQSDTCAPVGEDPSNIETTTNISVGSNSLGEVPERQMQQAESLATSSSDQSGSQQQSQSLPSLFRRVLLNNVNEQLEKHKLTKKDSKNIRTMQASPLKRASTFDSETHSQIPTISLDEVVMPGSELQQAMALSMAHLAETDEDECVICMETFDETNPRMPTLCGCGENKTFFHLPCLYQWIDQNENCPSCREKLAWEEF